METTMMGLGFGAFLGGHSEKLLHVRRLGLLLGGACVGFNAFRHLLLDCWFWMAQ